MPSTRTTPQNPIATLEDGGYRITTARREIVQVLESKADGFTVEQIANLLSHVGRATVYRTIKLFLKTGVLCKLSSIDGTPMYSISLVEHHHHTVCVGCGAVGEFRDTTIERLLRGLGSDIDGEMVGHKMEFYVRCRGCLNLAAN